MIVALSICFAVRFVCVVHDRLGPEPECVRAVARIVVMFLCRLWPIWLAGSL